MKVTFNIDTIEPMVNWLITYKNTGYRDEEKLKNILTMPDYSIELKRYALEGLPVCGINYEETFDFFMHFDTKEFTNPRLHYKQESFLNFFNHLEKRIEMIQQFSSISKEGIEKIERLLANGLPASIINQV